MTSLIFHYDHTKTVRENLAELYAIFEHDFITNTAFLNKAVAVDINRSAQLHGKPKVFWHVITREKQIQVRRGRITQTKKIRKFDENRAKRIRWIKHLILNFDDTRNNIFSFFYTETSGENRGKLRFYIWARDHDYVVILEKLGKNRSFLVTAFFVNEHSNKATYQSRYNGYAGSANIQFDLLKWVL